MSERSTGSATSSMWISAATPQRRHFPLKGSQKREKYTLPGTWWRIHQVICCRLVGFHRVKRRKICVWMMKCWLWDGTKKKAAGASWRARASIAIFVGTSYSTSLSVHNVLVLKQNHIYITDDGWDYFRNRTKGMVGDVGVYNVEDGSLELCDHPDLQLKWPPTVWIMWNPWRTRTEHSRAEQSVSTRANH